MNGDNDFNPDIRNPADLETHVDSPITKRRSRGDLAYLSGFEAASVKDVFDSAKKHTVLIDRHEKK